MSLNVTYIEVHVTAVYSISVCFVQVLPPHEKDSSSWKLKSLCHKYLQQYEGIIMTRLRACTFACTYVHIYSSSNFAPKMCDASTTSCYLLARTSRRI